MNENFLKFIITEDADLLTTMNIINENGQGIVFVCKKDILLGVITDGDIRRYILKEKTIIGMVKDVMNVHPVYSFVSAKSHYIKLIKEKNIKVLPIVDSRKRVVDIFFINASSQMRKKQLNIPVVIMAGGKGTRLYPYTQILPKPLILINDKTITELIMDRFEEYGCSQFTMIVNYKKEFIKAFFNDDEHQRNVVFIDEPCFLGTAGGLKLLSNHINETFFMSNCDILIEEDYSEILKFHKENKNIITLVCALKRSVFPYGTIETDANGKLLELKEKPTFEFLTNTGLYIIEPEFLDLIPLNKFEHITDTIQKCIDMELKVGVYPINEASWMDMGQLDELEKMRKKLNEK